MRFDEALSYLLSLGHETLAIKLGLTNTERLLDALERPQSAFPAVQIAGTNGKGSTAAMLDAICRASGLKTGLYTSPHLISITERIRIGGREIVPGRFARFVADVRAAAIRVQSEEGALPTFFEQVTAVAFLAFREAGVPVAILETGLGGRLDATTVARAATLAITPIALDHQEYLGNTLGEIAAEKAAIIHPGATVAVTPQPVEAMEVIINRCRECGITPRDAARFVASHSVGDAKKTRTADAGRLRADFETSEDRYEHVHLALRGRHQLTNAAVAIVVAEQLRERGFDISREAIIEGLEGATHAGRLELWPGTPALLFDGAHNAAGAEALRRYLDEFVEAPVTLIFGAMREKNLAEIASTLFPAARYLILTKPGNLRAATLETLKSIVPSSVEADRITLAATPAEALRAARQLTPSEGIICITGSLYLVGEAQQLLNDSSNQISVECRV